MIYLLIALLSGVLTDSLLMHRLKLKKYPHTIMLSLMAVIILIMAFENQLLIIKGFLFAQILIFAAYHDAKTKEILDLVHILILLAALINLNPVSAILGLIVVPLPYLVIVLIKDNSIGGGDIKLMATSGFFLGAADGIYASIIGLGLALCFNLFRKGSRSRSFPLAPYLAAGCFAAYLLFQ